jgi:hypothetical protein
MNLIQRWPIKAILLGLLPLALIAVGWTWFSLHYVYSEGERAGYVQKFSRKGWLCKTREGELSVINYPGAAAETFRFTVRNDSVAMQIDAAVGKHDRLNPS